MSTVTQDTFQSEHVLSDRQSGRSIRCQLFAPTTDTSGVLWCLHSSHLRLRTHNANVARRRT